MSQHSHRRDGRAVSWSVLTQGNSHQFSAYSVAQHMHTQGWLQGEKSPKGTVLLGVCIHKHSISVRLRLCFLFLHSSYRAQTSKLWQILRFGVGGFLVDA